MDEKKRVRISKKMAYYLRHNLSKVSEDVDSGGFVNISELLLLEDFKNVTLEDILKEVELNEKKRFSLDTTGKKIRANQGHSIESGKLIDKEKLLKKIDSPLEYCIHGTKKEYINSIMKSGLNRMNRTHIHFASEPHAISGFRKNSDVLIHINMENAIKDGIEFFISENRVILCEGPIDSKYFERVEYL